MRIIEHKTHAWTKGCNIDPNESHHNSAIYDECNSAKVLILPWERAHQVDYELRLHPTTFYVSSKSKSNAICLEELMPPPLVPPAIPNTAATIIVDKERCFDCPEGACFVMQCSVRCGRVVACGMHFLPRSNRPFDTCPKCMGDHALESQLVMSLHSWYSLANWLNNYHVNSIILIAIAKQILFMHCIVLSKSSLVLWSCWIIWKCLAYVARCMQMHAPLEARCLYTALATYAKSQHDN